MRGWRRTRDGRGRAPGAYRKRKAQALAEPREAAADRAYLDTAAKLCDGLEAVLKGYATAASSRERTIYAAWERTGPVNLSQTHR